MADVTGVTGRVSQQEELEKKQAAAAAKKRLNTEKLAATEKPDKDTKSINPFSGDSTELRALQERDRVKKAQEEMKARFTANPSEDPANMAGQTQVAQLNKMQIDYKFYRLNPEEAPAPIAV